MTKAEAAEVLEYLKAMYPNTYGKTTDKGLELAVGGWADAFSDMPVEAVMAAAKAYVATSTEGFAPTPGQIRDIIFRAMEKQSAEGLPSEDEAVMLVKSAVANGNYGSVEAFANLPPIIQDIVGWPGTLRTWAMLDHDEFETVVLSQFRRQYRDALKSGKTERKTPETTGSTLAESVKKMLASGDSLEAYIAGLLDGSADRR